MNPIRTSVQNAAASVPLKYIVNASDIILRVIQDRILTIQGT